MVRGNKPHTNDIQLIEVFLVSFHKLFQVCLKLLINFRYMSGMRKNI